MYTRLAPHTLFLLSFGKKKNWQKSLKTTVLRLSHLTSHTSMKKEKKNEDDKMGRALLL
tara:strand:- start:1074 stop:1250 length:177 start_codon:yes stop_codon:yes gene_type:complete